MMQIIKRKEKLIRLIIIIGVLLFVLSSVNAYFFDITYECENDVCVAGKEVIWHVDMFNKGTQVMEFIMIEMVDSINDTVIATYEIPFKPLTSERGDVIKVHPNHGNNVNWTSILPRGNQDKKLIFYPCFTNAVTQSYIVAKYGEYEKRTCYENYTMTLLDCLLSLDCGFNEFCILNRCKTLNCSDCQFISNHKCNDYDCCQNEDCNLDEVCLNNTCEDLNCSFDQYIDNRTCITLDCGDDEHIINRSCVKLDCGFDEYGFNGTCHKLNCKDNEYIGDHACKPLNCKFYEHAVDHACERLQCKPEEAIVDHACVPLNCYFFQDIKNHTCILSKSKVLQLVVELLVVAGIVVFVILDIRKFKKKKEAEKDNDQSINNKKIIMNSKITDNKNKSLNKKTNFNNNKK